MPEMLHDWNGHEFQAVHSKGGVVAVCEFADNLICDERLPWPPPPVVQKLYESRQSRAFFGAELTAATARLGFYSDLQSLNSEDAITWSYFGPFLAETPSSRARFLNWLLERVDWASTRLTIGASSIFGGGSRTRIVRRPQVARNSM